MDRQPDRGHAHHPFAQPGMDHPPADCTLQGAESPQQHQPRHPARRHAARQRKAHKPGRPDQPDQPSEQAVGPFPPVDAAKPREVHVGVDLAELGDLAILVELGLPCGVIERRDGTRHGLPFGYREARAGQPRGPAQGDHRRDHDEDHHQPQPHPAPRALPGCVDHAARWWGGAGIGHADLLEDGSSGHVSVLRDRGRAWPARAPKSISRGAPAGAAPRAGSACRPASGEGATTGCAAQGASSVPSRAERRSPPH